MVSGAIIIIITTEQQMTEWVALLRFLVREQCEMTKEQKRSIRIAAVDEWLQCRYFAMNHLQHLITMQCVQRI